jgi:hypothetical protein
VIRHEPISTALDAARERIGRRLQEAIDKLERDIAEVELWAAALDEFSKPAPDYDPTAAPLDRYILPERRTGRGRDKNSFPDRDSGAGIG